MAKKLPIASIRRIAAKAIGSPSAKMTAHLGSLEWDIAGSCENPISMTLRGQQELKRGRWLSTDPENGRTMVSMAADLHVRCRQCLPCRRYRALSWRDRILPEITQARRTWFGTLTWGPDWHTLALFRAITAAKRAGVEWHELDQKAQFQRNCDALQSDVDRYWKRVRKNSGSKMRYFAIYEPHKAVLAGYPHLHMLVHEVSGPPLTYRCLSNAWGFGHSKFKLLDLSPGVERAAGYVTKYMTKDMSSRVYASSQYGSFTYPDRVLVDEPSSLDEDLDTSYPTTTVSDFTFDQEVKGDPDLPKTHF